MLFDAKAFMKGPKMTTAKVAGQTVLVYTTNYYPAWQKFGHAISWAYVCGLEDWEGV